LFHTIVKMLAQCFLDAKWFGIMVNRILTLIFEYRLPIPTALIESERIRLKIILIQPPVQDFYDTDIRLQPLGLCMLKGAVKKFLPQVEVQVRDYHHGFGRKTIPLPSDLAYLKDYYPYPDASPFCSFHHYYHFGASLEMIAGDVAREKPDLVGISSLFSPYHRVAVSCAREIKKQLPVPILMGGSHVSASPFSALQDRNVDFIIRGEGERPLVEFLRAYSTRPSFERVPNLGFRYRGEAVLNPLEENYCLDDLPAPDFSDLRGHRYFFKGKPLCFVTTSRGCPHQCAFCSVRTTFGRAFRRRTPERVLNEIRKRYKEGYRVIDFEDDNLTFHRQDFKKILEAVIADFPRGELELLAMNGLSYLSLDGEILNLMARAGFRHLDLSLVSANADVLKTLQRPHSLVKFLEVVHLAHSFSFHLVAYQILGLPQETLADMVHTMALLASLPVLIGGSIFYLTPGCPLAETFPEMAEIDVFKARSTAMAVETPHFCRDDLYTLFVTARIINFFKGLRFEKKEVTFQEALSGAEEKGPRDKIGAELLQKLFHERCLYAASREGLEPLPRFRTELFFRVLEKAGTLQTTQGIVIELPPFSPSQTKRVMVSAPSVSL
jgi:radical SAM superfamily enzyme YgiQ (UPF0313 family)